MLARFLTNTRGGVTPLMAVVAVPLMASVGIAVDYSRINAARTAFQVALDATALMMSKNAATGTDAQRQTEATNIFNSLFSRPEVTNITVSPTYTSAGGSKLTLNGTAVVHTNFLGIIGVSQVDISALSVSTWGNTRLRVALALDNTGSMASDGKMDALKTASHNLLTQLKNAAVHAEDVYVSIVPFSKDVNFGPDNYEQSWLRWDLWDAVNGTCSSTKYHKQSNCVSNGKIWTPAPPQHLEWLRDRPRPELRHQERRTRVRRYVVSGRTILFVLGSPARSDQRLDQAERKNRCHGPGWQHQPGDRVAGRLAKPDSCPLHDPDDRHRL